MRRIFGLTMLSILCCASAAGATPAAVQGVDDIASVRARLETETTGTSTKDDADDIAIWLDRNDPSKSLVIGTDKKRGLYVYGMDGRIRSHANSGKINNVDLRNDVMIDGRPRTVVAASDENQPDAMIAVYILDTETASLVLLGRVSGGSEKAYGLCLYQKAGKLWAFNVFRNGLIEQVALDISGGVVRATPERTMKLKGNAEGCVADDRTGSFYAAERDIGIWKWGAGPDADVRPVSVARTDKSRLVADVEGLAIAAYGTDGGYLIASSQGADTFLLYRLSDNGYAGRFRIADGTTDGTSHTDGIELVQGDFGPEFPGGLFVAQDDNNRPQPQNFKFVAWGDIVKALHLAPDAPAAHDHH